MNRNLTILVIEDNAEDVVFFKRAMAGENINNPIQVVADGDEAIKYLDGDGQYADRTKFPYPGCIFTDLNMPRMSGFEVLQWLRFHPECSTVPLIILSSSDSDADVRKAYELGANAYLVKPTQIEELQEMLKTAYSFWSKCAKPALIPASARV